MDIIHIRLRKLQWTFTKLVNNVELETSKHEGEDNFDFQFRNFHSGARMTSCDAETLHQIMRKKKIQKISKMETHQHPTRDRNTCVSYLPLCLE